MKKISLYMLGILALVLSAGCSSTTITETTYNADGTVASTKVTETSDSPIVVGISNTKDKHVLGHIGGWYANVGVQPNSNSYGIGVGSIDNTYASIVASDGTKDGKDVAKQFAKIVNASKYKLSVSTEGVGSENETVSTNQKAKKEGQ